MTTFHGMTKFVSSVIDYVRSVAAEGGKMIGTNVHFVGRTLILSHTEGKKHLVLKNGFPTPTVGMKQISL